MRKNYSGADFVFYLPLDTAGNARKFIERVDPALVFFVKYEFWPNYLKIIHQNGIPLISFSTIFRKEQVFFRWYGGGFRRLLTYFNRLFIQNESSAFLLESLGIENYEIAGDTRFDRVKKIAEHPKSLEEIRKFVDNTPCMVIGSSWPEDMEVILPLIQKNERKLKFIIAPHEIDEEHILQLIERIGKQCIRYTEMHENQIDADVLVVDTIGLLSSIYQFADLAFVGGAYGKGLHNILEAVIFRIPVFFGDRNYQKFQEALDLIRIGAAAPVRDTNDLDHKISRYMENEQLRIEIRDRLDQYIESNLGATEKIIRYCKQMLL